jgi:hypothetical protein
MQRAKFNASCWGWVWLGSEAELPEELELLGEPELPEALELRDEPAPHAAIAVLARMTAAAAGSFEAARDMGALPYLDWPLPPGAPPPGASARFALPSACWTAWSWASVKPLDASVCGSTRPA